MNSSAHTTKNNNISTIVSTRSLWKSFQTGDHYTTVLKDISVEIKGGEFVILFGPSGCGKSTFLNTVMGLEHPDKGDVKFMGMDIWNLNSDDRAVIRKTNLGIIYQQQNWIKALDVLDNVALIGSLLGHTREESETLAMEKLELVGMTHRANNKPYELSSGEQQRISLARSLMSEPSIIIADEPTGNLDVKNGVKVMNILKELSQNGKTILMVTHNPGYFEFADRVIFMIDGKVRKDLKVTPENVEEMKLGVMEDIEKFISNSSTNEDKDKLKINAPKPVIYTDDIGKNFRDKILRTLDSIKFVAVFTLSMILLLMLYLPMYIVEKIFTKIDFSERISQFIMKFFNTLEGKKRGVQPSISSWDLGEISLNHLMEKKSRSLITILGVGVGIGFITFLLSLGYGLERLVVDEIAEIEERNQIVVDPVVGSEVVIDDERYQLIEDVEGVLEIHPLINVATTVYFRDSQTDIVAYGVHPEYLVVSQETFIEGINFTDNQNEIVISQEVLSAFGLDEKEILDKTLDLEFIPVDEEEEILSIDENVEGVYDNKVTYTVKGVVTHGSTPIIFFPLKDARELGISTYSELLLVLDDSINMNDVRRNIETLGMETSSVMDTVSEIERLFRYLRIGLTALGAIAFLIAILGMINTLTVSLMERTREVGLLKSIGMRSQEVKKLFITESMLIAFFGGVSGILLGSIFGLLISLIFSIVSVSNGGDYIYLSKIPLYLILSIIFISVAIGFLTGLYPSKRAVNMSPLDALRYE